MQPFASEVVAVDGKSVRRSYDKAAGTAVIEIVSAWARNQRLSLGQVKIANESNEIRAVPELLQTLDLEGAVVTVDALNTQKEIAACIREQKADEVLALKGNHGHLHKEVAELFCVVKEERTYGYIIELSWALDKERSHCGRGYHHTSYLILNLQAASYASLKLATPCAASPRSAPGSAPPP